MGYELTRFISKISDHYCCSICTMVLEDPVQTPCEHVFCSECIKCWLVKKRTCPVDRSSLRIDDLKRAPKYFRKILNKLKVRCELESSGCNDIIKLEDIRIHPASCKHSIFHKVNCEKCKLSMSRYVYTTSDCFYHFTRQLRLQDIKINERRYEVGSIDKEIMRLNDEVNLNNEYIRKLNDRVDSKYKGITKLNDEVKLKDEEIAQLNIDLTKLIAELSLLNGDILPFLDKNDYERFSNDYLMNFGVRGTDKECTKLKEEVNSKTEAIEELNQVLDSKDEAIKELRNKVDANDYEIQLLTCEVDGKGEEITKLKYEAHRRDENLFTYEEENNSLFFLEMLVNKLPL